MAERKSFLLRVDRDTLDAVQRWANDDLRSLNGQIEFLLRRALQQARRAPNAGESSATDVGDIVTGASGDSPPE
ncbi:MAG: hypothetical protein ABJB66_13500 [Gemmatimonadaceae bacterium]